MKVTTDACLFGAWVARQIATGKVADPRRPLLDIGAGTGLLSLMVAQKNPLLRIDAIEIDEGAADQAGENRDASPWRSRIQILRGDARRFPFPETYDYIISNPPFYENELPSPSARKNIAHHGGELKWAELLPLIRRQLKEEGRFFLLLPYKRNKELRKLLTDHDLVPTEIVLVRQSPQHDYFRMIITGGKGPASVQETALGEMMIRDEKNQYSSSFVELLRDYYLYL